MMRELTMGIDGDDVRALQTVLYELGYTEIGTPDSQFGEKTITAVNRFQSEHYLTVSGVVDDATRATVVAEAEARGVGHLSWPLAADGNALAHGVAPTHHEVHDLSAHAAPASAAHDGHIPADAQRSEDGFYWWDGTAWQPVHADAAHGAAHGTGAGHDAAHKSDYMDLIQGFTDLTVAAVNHDKILHNMGFGAHLSPDHHSLLEHVRKTFIEAQGDDAARQRAAQDWASLEAHLQAAAGEAHHAGISAGSILTFTENIATVGEGYVHARHKGAAHMESGDDYAGLVKGINDILVIVYYVDWDRTSGVYNKDIEATNPAQRTALQALAFDAHVTPAHRELLENLRQAFVLARTMGSARAALAQWQSVQPALHHALTRAPEMVTTDLTWINHIIGEMDEKLFHQGVIAEAEHAATSHSPLQEPDLPLQKKRLEEAAEGVAEIDALMKKTQSLTSEYALSVFLEKGSVKPELARAIWEIAMNPHEIYEKLEEFKKKGVIEQYITVADMADKVLAVRNGVAEVIFETVHSVAKKKAEEFAARGAAEIAKDWAGTAKWAEENIKVLERVKTAATVITIAVGAIKVIDAIVDGRWEDAIKEAANTGIGLAIGAAAGTAGTVMLAGVTLVVAAEMEGIRGAAAMIRYAHNANEHEAALTFIGLCTDALNLEAKDLVADAEILRDPANAGEKKRIEAKLDSLAQYWRRHLHQLSALYLDDRENTIGGQPELKKALGSDAERVLQSPDEGSQLTGAALWDTMAHQIGVVFAGTNRMTQRWVETHPAT